MRNYSPKTLASYRWWIVKFQAFVHSRPTAELGTQEVRGFLSELAVRYGVAASSQNHMLNIEHSTPNIQPRTLEEHESGV